MAVAAGRRVKDLLNQVVGWHVLFEARNRILLGPSVIALRRIENEQVERLCAPVGGHGAGGAAQNPAARPSALVATVIATYKRPEALLDAVHSALAQTVEDQVVIVVDDGGGLPDLPADPRLTAVSLIGNIGIAGVVRNIGIRLTDSRYVAFLDDDNTWEPDHLERALAVLQADDGPSGVYTALRRVRPDGTDMDVLSVPFDRRLATRKAFLDTNAFVARRNRTLRFSRIRRTREVLPREDWELMYRYSRHHRIVHIPHATVRYLVNPDTFYTEWKR